MSTKREQLIRQINKERAIFNDPYERDTWIELERIESLTKELNELDKSDKSFNTKKSKQIITHKKPDYFMPFFIKKEPEPEKEKRDFSKISSEIKNSKTLLLTKNGEIYLFFKDLSFDTTNNTTGVIYQITNNIKYSNYINLVGSDYQVDLFDISLIYSFINKNKLKTKIKTFFSSHIKNLKTQIKKNGDHEGILVNDVNTSITFFIRDL